MCGIIGYVGNKNAILLLLNGFEHIGYDSAGLAIVNENSLNVLKRSGKVESLKSRVNDF